MVSDPVDTTRADVLEDVSEELVRLQRLVAQLDTALSQALGRAQQVEELSKETLSELLLLLTAARPVHAAAAPDSRQTPALDEYIEDMIDPEFGLQPARSMITRAAERLLNGYDAFRFPSSPPEDASGDEDDEDS